MFNEICINEEMLPIYIYIYMIKISGKMNKSDTYKGFSSSDISFFIPRIYPLQVSDYFIIFHFNTHTHTHTHTSIYIYIYIYKQDLALDDLQWFTTSFSTISLVLSTSLSTNFLF